MGKAESERSSEDSPKCSNAPAPTVLSDPSTPTWLDTRRARRGLADSHVALPPRVCSQILAGQGSCMAVDRRPIWATRSLEVFQRIQARSATRSTRKEPPDSLSDR